MTEGLAASEPPQRLAAGRLACYPMAERTTLYMRLDELQRAPRNAKGHAEELIAASLGRWGVIEHQVIDERTGALISGHGRLDELLALRSAGAPVPDGVLVGDDGMWLAPVSRGWASVDDLDADAAAIALNRIGEVGGWESNLSGILDELATNGSLEAVGYSREDFDRLVNEAAAAGGGSSSGSEPERLDVPERVTAGDVWALGAHRLLCGDCRDAKSVKRLLDGAEVNVAFTSPPYADRRKYDETSGFRPVRPEEYVAWFAPVAANVAEHLAVDGSWFVNIKPSAEGLDTEMYVLDLVLAHAREWGWHFATEFCWERPGVPKEPVLRFKNAFELVFQFTRGRWKFRPDNVRYLSAAAVEPLGPGAGDTSWGDRNRMSNASRQGGVGDKWFSDRHVDGFAYPSNRLPTFAGSHEATGHSAAFPVGLPAWFVRAYSDPGDTLLDPFAGSGSTLLAAEQERRVCYGIEISAGYCDVILARWEHHHPDQPVELVDRG